MSQSRVESLQSWHDDWSGLRVAVLGLGVTGFSVADTLAELGVTVHVIAGTADEDRERILAVLGVTFVTEPDDDAQLRELFTFNPDLVVVSPGYRPDHPLTEWAISQDIPVWSDIQLAWRLRDKVGEPAEWITVTGTNGKTTTTQLAAHMLVAGGHRAAPVGNIGVPILDAIRDPLGYDVLVVELSSFQLHRLGALSPYSSVCLNIADDHLDWHGSREAYIEAKGRVYEHTRVACVYNRADAVTEQLVRDADVVEGARAVSFGLDTPPPSGLGIVEGLLIDRGFHEERFSTALEIVSIEELDSRGLGAPHLMEDVLAAAALARSYGVTPEAIAGAILTFIVDAHRVQQVTAHEGVQYIDDSKATNTHAAEASLKSFPSIVWIVGGLLKGAEIDSLVSRHAKRLKAAVVIGVDRDPILAALKRHAPDVPVAEVISGETEDVMHEAVKLAREFATEGDTVLLSPAAASMDQFESYEDRGRQFQRAVMNQVQPGDTPSREDERGADDDTATPNHS